MSTVAINNINISNKSKDEINSLFTNLIEKKQKKELKLYYNSSDKKYEKKLDLSILNIKYNLDDCISKAYSIGRTGNIFQNNFTIAKTLLLHKNLNLELALDDEMLDTIILDISANLPDKKIDNTYYIEDNNLIITKGTAGLTVDKENFIKDIKKFISDLSSEEDSLQIPTKYVEPDEINVEKIHSEIYKESKDAYFESDPFKVYAEVEGIDFNVDDTKKKIKENPNNKEYIVKLDITHPKKTLANLNINVFPDLLGTFSTQYSIGNANRVTNLELAAEKISGTVLSPGEEFSYNKIVGERSIAAGYKEAKVYEGGKIVDGLGGGICQISSTLYNAVVYANLKVSQRFNHQFITSYVDPGRDATVAYGSKDFKFINNRTYPIKINVIVDSGIARVDIYGIKEENEYQITIDTEVISNIPFDTVYETDSSLSAGTQKVKQRGVDGVIVNAYKITNEKGVAVSKELLSKDTYNSLNKIIVKSSN